MTVWQPTNLPQIYINQNCGSEPARDGDGSVNIDVECTAVIASRLAPTFNLLAWPLLCGDAVTVESGLLLKRRCHKNVRYFVLRGPAQISGTRSMNPFSHWANHVRQQYQLGKITLVILILLGLGGIGAITQSLLTVKGQTDYPAPGQMVSVGDHRLHIHCEGHGQPIVLLESGLSGWSQDWALVQPELARTTTVCAYDRAGYAWSDESPTARTGLLAVDDLRTLLHNANLHGRMVVVGHSLGGLLAQMLAQTHPDEVAGLVLIDALQHDQTFSMDPEAHARYSRNMDLLTNSATWLAPLGLTRLTNMPASVVLDKLPLAEQPAARALAMQSKNYRALRTEYLAVDSALDVARKLAPIPAMPIVVLSTNAQSEFPPGWETEYMRQHWIDGQRALARETGSQQVVVAEAGHYLQLERPKLVIDSVLTVLHQVRNASKNPVTQDGN